jgi:ParB-like chromosome segregation protein Spo0J
MSNTKGKPPKLKANPFTELTQQKQATVQALTGIAMSEIRYVAPERLRPNPLNSIFPDESEAYFEELSADISERGITDPLVAKPDGTLLTGHNRLTIAKRLGLPRVPVRYVQSGMTDETKEIEFVIKDNLLRRHLNDTQRMALYERLYPNFHERRSKAIEYGKTLSAGGGNAVTPPDDMLTVQDIAGATGQKPENVKQQLARFYRKHPEKLESAKEAKVPENINGEAPRKNGHTPAALHRTFTKHFSALREVIENADDRTRKTLVKELKQLLKGL